MLKIKSKKKFLIPLFVMVLIIAMAGSALASFTTMQPYYWTDFYWTDTFGLNSISNHDTYETYLIQRVMNGILDLSLSVDGDYGTNTYNAVLSFQQLDGDLDNDGIVGPDTWDAFQMLGTMWERYPYVLTDGSLYYVKYRAFWDSGDYYIRHYNTGRWKVQRGNLDWRYVN